MVSDMADLLSTLATLRLALPSTLLLLLLGRFAAKGFVALIARIQAQDWVETDTDYGPIDAPNRTNASAVDGEDEDGIVLVVLVVKTPRRTWIVAFFGLVAATYFADGMTQVIASLITSTFEPSEPLFRHMIPYTVGGLLSYVLCVVAMTLQERTRKKQADWGRVYPRALVLVGLTFDAAVAYYFGRVVQQGGRQCLAEHPQRPDNKHFPGLFLFRTDASMRPPATPLPSIHLGILALRLLLLVMLSLLQSSLLYKRSYVPKDGLTTGERASLLGNGGFANGDSGDYGTIPGKPAYGPLRSSRPPSNRPPDPKSLSILTLFSRVRILFPYLWPSKSLSLQIVSLVCIGLMLFRRVVNVWVPLLLGRVVSDLSAGRPPYLNVGLYTVMSFLARIERYAVSHGRTLLPPRIVSTTNGSLPCESRYQYLSLPIKQYSEREMSMLSFDCLLNLSLSYHTHRKTGELLRILGRADAINDFFQILIFSFVPVIIDLPVAAVVIGYRYGWGIVSIVTGVSIVFVATSIVLAESRTKLYRKLRDESQFMHQIKTDTLFNWETVKIFTAERFESERLRNALRVYQKGSFKVYSAWNSLSLMQNGISSVGFLVCSFILSRRIVRGELEVGEFVTFSSFLNQLYTPLNQIATLYRQVMSSLVDTEQLMELLNEKKDIVDRPNALPLVIPPGQGGTIEFDNVKFSYDDKFQTIKGVSFKIQRGQSVALVGPSGSGKSTIMRLVYRFFDVSEGRILVDGVDVRDYSQVTLRNAIGLVPQESILFNETARYNIAYGGGIETTTEQMIEAARSAAIHDRIMSFPDRYETRVGERGQRLSGGEKQRVAIARVLLKNPPILLLDEATSALDTTNERLIQARLRELSRGRTTLAIAHRLSTIVDCDVIHVLAEGKIVESGSHNELLEQDGVYAELWRKQSESEEGPTPPTGSTRSATPTVKT